MILNLLFAVVGAFCLLFGLWLIYPPAMFVVAGVGLLALGFLREVPDGREAKSR